MVFVVPIVQWCGVGGLLGCLVGGLWHLFVPPPPDPWKGLGAIFLCLLGLVLLIAFIIVAKGLGLILGLSLNGPIDKQLDKLARAARALFAIPVNAATAAGQIAKATDKSRRRKSERAS